MQRRIRAARKQAKPGDLIPAAVAAQIVKICTDDFHFRNSQIKRAALQEVPNTTRPVINRTYPENEALATVPPLLLSKLPELPDNLQYRFFGRHLVFWMATPRSSWTTSPTRCRGDRTRTRPAFAPIASAVRLAGD